MMGDDASVIHSQLLVPFAGYRYYDGAEVYGLGGSVYLRSSSPNSTEASVLSLLVLDCGWENGYVQHPPCLRQLAPLRL